ncbi:uncharacterized protein [Triticum aestivum]|uniref:uncharacterized protein isoform X2 n=1 Tax=Triticum aestivum TaxID=4565 RepID=UPI001D01A528|nr:uncharacterized protein LOC123052771 isoform X2 [Triticum aestivum]XP_045088941.1 uncharacterized protein LOC109784303 isoform X2 [Aegilops tauschii subsp. strangulata]
MAAATERVRTHDAMLKEHETLPNTQAKDLASREQALAAAICAKDNELESLVQQHTKHLEDSHKRAINLQAHDAAAKLKEISNNLAATSAIKTELETHAGKLEEEVAGKKKKIEALREEARKTSSMLEGLQSHLTSKDQVLKAASSTIEDLSTKLDTLEKGLEQAKDPERALAEEVNTTRALSKDAEDKLKEQVELYNLWSKSLVNIDERISSQIATMNMKS